MTSSSDSYSLYTSTVQSDPLLLMQHLCPTHAFKPLIPFQAILYLLPLLPHHHLSLLAVSLHLWPPYPILTPSGFFNGVLAFSKPGGLNCYTFFCLISLTLFVSSNLTLTHLPLSRFLDSLLCALIALTPGLAFSLLMPCTPVAASSFLSGRAYSFLNFLPPLFLCLNLTPDYVRVNISLNNSLSLIC